MASSVPSLLSLSKAIATDDARSTVSPMDVGNACMLHDVTLSDAASDQWTGARSTWHGWIDYPTSPAAASAAADQKWAGASAEAAYSAPDADALPTPWGPRPDPCSQTQTFWDQFLGDSRDSEGRLMCDWCGRRTDNHDEHCRRVDPSREEDPFGRARPVVVACPAPGRKRRGGTLDERPSLGPRMEWFQCNICCRWCNQRCDCERNGAAPCYS